MGNLLAHATGSPHTENSSLMHWLTTDILVAISIILLSLIAVTVLLYSRQQRLKQEFATERQEQNHDRK